MPPFLQGDLNAPRFQRGSPPDYELNGNNVGTAKPFLLRDSGGRCAYSMIHEREIGRETIEVDHFDPRKVGGKKNHNYDNLLPAYGPCNRSKSNKWPSPEAEASGVRFLNPTVEGDYGVHLFEDPLSHKIIGFTPAGRYHLRHLMRASVSFTREPIKPESRPSSEQGSFVNQRPQMTAKA
jgi:HNH endonuclease